MVRCIDCFKFKKTLVTLENIDKGIPTGEGIRPREYKDNVPLRKRLNKLLEVGEEPAVTLYFCKETGRTYMPRTLEELLLIQKDECQEADI
jgi:hypothetical protein